jgi:hypothetical protein
MEFDHLSKYVADVRATEPHNIKELINNSSLMIQD